MNAKLRGHKLVQERAEQLRKRGELATRYAQPQIYGSEGLSDLELLAL